MHQATKSSKNKVVKYAIFALILIFATIGFFLSIAFLAVKFKLTNDSGSVDFNNRYFTEYARSSEQSSTINLANQKELILAKTLVINKYRPDNAQLIMSALASNSPLKEVNKMVEAVEMQFVDDEQFINDIQIEVTHLISNKRKQKEGNVFEWMNIPEWQDFKIAVEKDKHLIDSVSLVTGVESRLIVSVLVGEQIRLFNSNREAYKKWIGPLKILSVERNFSLGVTGIKEPTALFVEKNLKDSISPFYCGKRCENLLDFKSTNQQSERYERLTTYKNHFYSYMYAALILKQVKLQWERAGFPIENRPEILATLFNVGFEMSVPKAEPRVGGSTIQVKENSYTFGAIAYQFYYSGDLVNLFPYKLEKFEW